jgi:Tfp pilus assembly PilM family ATPase
VRTTIGIDIGFETVKVIGLSKVGRHWSLRGMNIAPIPHNSWQTETLTNSDAIAAAIRDALKHAQPSPINGRWAMIALPESVIFSSTFSMPPLEKHELAQAIPFELAEKLSIDLEEFYFDYEVVSTKCKPVFLTKSTKPDEEKVTDPKEDPGQSPKKEEELGVTVFAVAVKQTLIQSVLEMCQKAGVELGGIDIKPGAIARAVIVEGDDKARAIIDLGVGSTGASIAEGQSIRVTSTVPWGVKALLDTHLPINQLRQNFAAVFDELVHITKFFENRVCPGVRVEEIILSGSGTNVAGVLEAFQQETGLKTRLGQPFEHVNSHHYPIKPEHFRTFADAVGLAMRKE